MTNRPTKKTIFTVKSSITLASKWRASKRAASAFADEYPEAYKKISYARTRRNALTSAEEHKVANWLVQNA